MQTWWRSKAAAAWLAVVLVVVALVAAGVVRQQRAADLRVDRLYCTLSGVTVFDRAPNSGRFCGEIR